MALIACYILEPSWTQEIQTIAVVSYSFSLDMDVEAYEDILMIFITFLQLFTSKQKLFKIS